MDYTILKPAVASLLAAHPDWTDQQLADGLNAKTVACIVPLTSSQLLDWLGANGAYTKLETAADNVALGDAVRSVCKVALLMLQRPDTTVDFNRPDHQAMAAVLVAAGVATQDQVSQLQALAAGTQSRADQLGLPYIYPGYVTSARAMS
jgi:hypothetical protein